VFLHGENFPAGSRVYFGVDPWSGAGGKLAPSVLLRESGVLEVLTPAHASGSQSVLVVDPETGQGTLLAAAYTFHGSSGAGACSVQSGAAPAGPSAALGWLLAFGALLLRSRWRRLRWS
jgi:MYXO-CTERM domain-containing protein